MHEQEETKFEEELIDSTFEEVILPANDVTLSLEKQEKEIIIRALKKNKIELDRKILADLAEHNPKTFAKVLANLK
jgi:uncharacterized protein YijF (DUF1287 family)